MIGVVSITLFKEVMSLQLYPLAICLGVYMFQWFPEYDVTPNDGVADEILCTCHTTSGMSGSSVEHPHPPDSANCEDYFDRCTTLFFKSVLLNCSEIEEGNACLNNFLKYCQHSTKRPKQPRNTTSSSTTYSTSERKNKNKKENKSSSTIRSKAALYRNVTKDAKEVDVTQAPLARLEDLMELQNYMERLMNDSIRTCDMNEVEESSAANKITWSYTTCFIGCCCLVLLCICSTFH